METRLAAVEVVLDQQQPGVSALAVQRLTRDADALWPGIPNPGALQCTFLCHCALVSQSPQLCAIQAGPSLHPTLCMRAAAAAVATDEC